MFEKLKEITGTEPVARQDGSFSPSRLSLKVAAPSKTDYDHATYANALTGGDRKVLVICTEEQYLTTADGDRFYTGNHPVELFVVLLHLEQAGFGFHLATLSGASVKIEDWAMPEEDDAVRDIMGRSRAQLEHPLVLADVVANRLGAESPYAAVFIPGGHGATVGLPDSPDVKKALAWVMNSDRHLISICHGPAAFLSLAIDGNPDDFPLRGYEYAGFPDSGDRFLPYIGYLPGKMPWYFGEKLDHLGMKNLSHLPSGKIHQDRKLLTGDGPLAANKLGGLAARALLEVYG